MHVFNDKCINKAKKEQNKTKNEAISDIKLAEKILDKI